MLHPGEPLCSSQECIPAPSRAFHILYFIQRCIRAWLYALPEGTSPLYPEAQPSSIPAGIYLHSCTYKLDQRHHFNSDRIASSLHPGTHLCSLLKIGLLFSSLPFLQGRFPCTTKGGHPSPPLIVFSDAPLLHSGEPCIHWRLNVQLSITELTFPSLI
jgi:hypothetical protein